MEFYDGKNHKNRFVEKPNLGNCKNLVLLLLKLNVFCCCFVLGCHSILMLVPAARAAVKRGCFKVP